MSCSRISRSCWGHRNSRGKEEQTVLVIILVACQLVAAECSVNCRAESDLQLNKPRLYNRTPLLLYHRHDRDRQQDATSRHDQAESKVPHLR